MSILPLLAGLFICTQLLEAGVDLGHFSRVLLAGILSLVLAVYGFHLVQKAASARTASARVEDEIRPETPPDAKGADATDELEELSRSLKTIARNAKELMDKVDRLQVRDRLTGLYNATYIRERLTEEIERAIAYQRPCSFACLLVKNLDEYIFRHGESAGETALKEMASLFRTHLREFDRAARVGKGEFMIIFPDRNKKKCIEAVEKIAQSLKGLELCAGISENPIDGVQADSLYVKAQGRMRQAKTQNKLYEAFI